jgi:hypothetical protein
MLFWNKICGLIAIFFLCGLFSSAQVPYSIKSLSNKVQKQLLFKPAFTVQNLSYTALNISKPFAVISPNYYTQHFGIMCKKELALEKAIKIPFRFRLGSVQQCNYLEGKR